jgi:hypothetical protein
MICTPHRYYSDEQTKADMMRGARGTYANEMNTELWLENVNHRSPRCGPRMH